MANKIIRCAECGEEIPVGEDYYSCDDNFLQVKYFDTNADNCFCSIDCMCNALSIGSHENDGNVEFGEEMPQGAGRKQQCNQVR